MKKNIWFALILISILNSCMTTPKTTSELSDEQKQKKIEDSIYVVDYWPEVYKNENIKKVAVFSFGNDEFTDCLTAKIVTDSKWYVVDRNNLDMIMEEQAFQQSGIVNESEMISIGKIAGVQMVIFGEYRGDSAIVKAIDVQTAEYLAFENVDLKFTSYIDYIKGVKYTEDIDFKSAKAITALLPSAIVYIDGYIEMIQWGINSKNDGYASAIY